MADYNENHIARLKHLASLATRTKNELDLTFRFAFVILQTGTELVENFAFSAATYPGATNPNLDGKPVLVLAVKGDKSIDISGYNISVKRSAVTGNLLELKSDGLFVGSDDTKADKVTGATAGNIATLDANGNLVDSGVTFASDTDVNTMLTSVFGA